MMVDTAPDQPPDQVGVEIRMRHAPQIGAIAPEEMGEPVLLPRREGPVEPVQ
jgi:hypothetical protein